ncbi:MAG TPA: glycosyltransferase family 2 protein [Gemmataceae bacterium]|jgi:glycosyltransferase involved in cell wall biosynthesis
MPSSIPTISVSMITYNHEKYIGEAIRSVLSQTFTDLELIVVDDGSTDATPRVIADFDDPRLMNLRQENQGPSAAANRGLSACRGRYVALMSGDDVCHPDRLARQLEEYQRGPTRLLFSSVDLIDENSRPVTKPSFCDGIFNHRCQSRAEIYRRFFHSGNFINAITCFTETELLCKSGFCNPLLLQLQDFDLWVRLIKRYDFTFLPQPVLSYRIRGDGQNLSGQGTDPWVGRNRWVRSNNELYLVMRHFFDGVSPELFYKAFRDELLRPEYVDPIAMRCEQAFLLARSLSPYQQLVGIEKLQELLLDPEAARTLQKEFQFNVPTFSHLLGELPVFDLLTPNYSFSTLFFDAGAGFNDAETCRRRVNLLNRRFDITFDLSDAPLVRQLRWDPFEGRLSRVHVEEIVWRTPEGEQGIVDMCTISANGVRGEDGVFTLDTLDPMIFVPFTGPLGRLTLRGWWDIENADATRTRFLSLLRDHDNLRCELALRKDDLARRDEQLHNILTSRRWKVASTIHSIFQLLGGRRSA